MLRLKKAALADEAALYEYISTVLPDENGFLNDHFGCAREGFAERVLQVMQKHEKGLDLPAGYVPETHFFLWDEDEVLGWFRLRHHLCPSLVTGGGHIGYSIREGCRGRGYATAGLGLLLKEASAIVPEEEYYLRVMKSNPASRRVMEKNGGYLHHEDDTHWYVRIRKEPV